MNIIWWHSWHLVEIDVFQLYRMIVDNKIYITMFRAEIMMKADSSLHINCSHHFYTSHLTWKTSYSHTWNYLTCLFLASEVFNL